MDEWRTCVKCGSASKSGITPDRPRRWKAFALLDYEGQLQLVRFTEQADNDHSKIMKELKWSEIPVEIVEIK